MWSKVEEKGEKWKIFRKKSQKSLKIAQKQLHTTKHKQKVIKT